MVCILWSLLIVALRFDFFLNIFFSMHLIWPDWYDPVPVRQQPMCVKNESKSIFSWIRVHSIKHLYILLYIMLKISPISIFLCNEMSVIWPFHTTKLCRFFYIYQFILNLILIRYTYCQQLPLPPHHVIILCLGTCIKL